MSEHKDPTDHSREGIPAAPSSRPSVSPSLKSFSGRCGEETMTEHRHSDGFTLIELMLVVLLIGILAAIAIPNFLGYQAKARRSESYSNLAARASCRAS